MKKSVMPEQKTTLTDEKMSNSRLVALIVSINLFILVFGGGLIYWLTLEKKPDFNLVKKFKIIADVNKRVDGNGVATIVGLFAKIFKPKAKPKESTAEKN